MKAFKNSMNKNFSSRYMKMNRIDRTKGYFSFYMICILFIFISFTPSANSIIRRDYSGHCMRLYYYQINVKIYGLGYQQITSSLFTSCPTYYAQNGYNIKTSCYQAYIQNYGSQINTISLIWDRANSILAHLFENITNILEVDFTYYDTTGVTDMRNMFYNCKSLTSVNLQNINTRSVTNMRLMFYGCISLQKLDVT